MLCFRLDINGRKAVCDLRSAFNVSAPVTGKE
jgi:hypothetical protein